MILGLSGKALAGKDTVADYLIDHYFWTRKTGFATNLKLACMEVFNLTEFQVFEQAGKSAKLDTAVVVDVDMLVSLLNWMGKTHEVSLNDRDYSHIVGENLHTPRDILQFVGTEVMRYYASDYHMEVVFRSVDRSENVIITDVRFPNEAQSILDNGGKLVRISRPDRLREKYGASINSTHASEIALDGWSTWSHVIDNSSEKLSVLFNKTDKLQEKIKA